jgi:hypothetical protein
MHVSLQLNRLRQNVMYLLNKLFMYIKFLSKLFSLNVQLGPNFNLLVSLDLLQEET